MLSPPPVAQMISSVGLRWALLASLLALGLLGNYFNYPLFFEIDFLFGSIFSFLVLQFFGKNYGIGAALLASGVTYFIWGHPYAIVIMTAELAFVAWVAGRFKVSLVFADATYWVLIGMPLVYFFYHGVMGVLEGITTITLTKQAVNGITNVLLARLVFVLIGLNTKTFSITLREILHICMVFCIAMPMLMLIFIDSRSNFEKDKTQTQFALTSLTGNINKTVQIWLENRSAVLASLASVAAQGDSEKTQAALDLVRNADTHLLRTGFLNPAFVTTEYSPRLNELGRSNIGVDFSDRSYVPYLRERATPMLSETMVSRQGSAKSIVAYLHPVFKDGTLKGYVAGILSLDQISQFIESAALFSATRYTLVDKGGKVIVSNREDQKPMTAFVQGEGSFIKIDDTISQWIPKIRANAPLYERFRKSHYVTDTALGSLSEWRLVLEQPVAPVQKALSDRYTKRLILLLALLILGTILAELVSRKILHTFDILRDTTVDLPHRLATAQAVQWPTSQMVETQNLIVNFQSMADSLQIEFAEKQSANALLENRVAERTRDLEEVNHDIKRIAFYDTLTNLPNRRLLLDRLEQALASFKLSGKLGALIFIDLDHFKNLNDTRGHFTGDLLLQQVAQRLTECVREEDTVARIGGDEFVVMLQGLGERADDAALAVRAVGEEILSVLNQPYLLEGQEHVCSSSMGVALYEDGVVNVEDLLKRADLAMYQVKAAGRNSMLFFDARMQEAIDARTSLEKDLRFGMRHGQLMLYFQPQFHGEARVIGAEALLRWRHPKLGLVPPIEFIALAEETMLIIPIGHWVMEQACGQLVVWAQSPETAHLVLSVNVSARQFHMPDFVEQTQALLVATGANPARLMLEVTESLLLTDMEKIIEKMQALKALGIGFSLDDFGTGYSSLSYLKRMPLDQLKIDKSFVRDINTDANDVAIIQAITSMGQALNIDVIAEGVETVAQRDALARLGCEYFQGYLFGRPEPIEAFAQALSKG